MNLAAPALGSTVGHYIPLFAVHNTSGYSVLAAGIVLAIMVFPLIVAVVDEVMRSTPQEMRESLLSLGATKWEATRCIVRRRGLAGHHCRRRARLFPCLRRDAGGADGGGQRDAGPALDLRCRLSRCRR